MRLKFVVCLLITTSPLVTMAWASVDGAPSISVDAAVAPVSASPAAESATVTSLETVIVTGSQPGPGLWKVSHGEHVLWLLGTLSPLPRDMQWQSADVETAIATATAILQPPGVNVSADTGLFGRLLLLPSLINVRNNPDGAVLKEVLPADLYARWLPLKVRYIGKSNKVEKWRPVFAAMELYDEALKKNGLTASGQIKPVLARAATARGIEPTSTAVTVSIDNPRKAIKEFKSQGMDDATCLRQTIDQLDQELATMTSRANAWATGDIDALRALPHESALRRCFETITETAFGQRRGIGNLPQRIDTAWLAAAEKTLENHQSSFGSLPIAELLKPDGLLAKLQARGYHVETPEAVTDGPGEPSPHPTDTVTTAID